MKHIYPCVSRYFLGFFEILNQLFIFFGEIADVWDIFHWGNYLFTKLTNPDSLCG